MNNYARTISISQDSPGQTGYDHLNQRGRGWLVAGVDAAASEREQPGEGREVLGHLV